MTIDSNAQGATQTTEATPDDLVVVETMPDHLRDAHRAAGNWGTYPHNGAERCVVTRDEAEAAVSIDTDGYTWIVRSATRSDAEVPS